MLSIGIMISACKKQTDYQPQLDILTASINALKHKSDSLASVIATTNSNLSALSTKVDSIETKLDAIIIQINQLNVQLTSVSANITSINAQIAILNQQYVSLLAQLNAIIAQLAAIPTTLSTGLAAYYPFNGNANDLSGNGNNGTVNGATLAKDRLGNANSAYSFNGTNNLISLPAPFFGGVVNSQFSISLWFKTDVLNYQTIWNKDGIWQGLGIFLNSDGSILIHGTRANPNVYQNAITSGNVISANKWYNLIIIYNSTDCIMYVNGIQVSVTMNTLDQGGTVISNTMAGSVDWGETPGGNSNGTNQFGCSNSISTGNTAFFTGVIDDFRLYNRALNPQEITYLATY